MKKKILFFVTIIMSLLSFLCLFFPFITVEKYKPVTGFYLITHLFRRFEVAKTGDAYNAMFFTSTSLPLALSYLLLISSIILFALYYKKEKAGLLNAAVLTVVASFIAYGVNLSNSNTLPSDFFGNLLQGVPVQNGFIYQTANGVNVSTGIGARILAVSLAVSAACAVILKIEDYVEKEDKEKIQTPFIMAYRNFVNNKLALTGLIVIILITIICYYGPVFSNYSLLNTDVANAQQSPSAANLLGTDDVGRDVLTRLMFGGRISLAVGFTAVVFEVCIGTIIGGIAGYYRGTVDNVVMRIVDVFLCIPSLPLIIILGAVMSDLKVDPQSRIYILMLILGLLGWPGLARLLRGQMLSLHDQDFIMAEEVLGVSDRKKIFSHMIPNAIPNVIVYATLDVGGMILYESALSFLGLGVSTPYPSWGNIIDAVKDPNDFALRPWLWIPAGICILIVILAINLVGDGLRDAIDPKMKR